MNFPVLTCPLVVITSIPGLSNLQKQKRASGLGEGRKLPIANCNSRGGGSQSCGPPGTWKRRAFQLLLTEITFALCV